MNKEKNKNNEQTTVEPGTPAETEALRAMRESYEAQLQTLREEMANTREEHAKQIREILLSGRKPQKEAPADEEEETEEEHVQSVARAIADKILKR